jgi:tRNA (guanine-N7-)-methyltransferase
MSINPIKDIKSTFKIIPVSKSTQGMGHNISYHIKSFVRRESRITTAQQRALRELWVRFGIDIGFSIFEPEQLFFRSAPLILEIGFGDGESLAKMCLSNPNMDFIGIEVHRPGIGHLLLRAAEMELKNIRVINSDAVDVLEHYLTDECMSCIQIFFPDPWTKARHRKRRLIQLEFINLLIKKIKPGGQIYIATDCANYAHAILEILTKIPTVESMTKHNGLAPHLIQRPATKFERRSNNLGHVIYEIMFKKSFTT